MCCKKKSSLLAKLALCLGVGILVFYFLPFKFILFLAAVTLILTGLFCKIKL